MNCSKVDTPIDGGVQANILLDGLILRLARLDDAAEWERYLGAEEIHQLVRFKNETRRARFVVSRGIRRKLVADCLGRPAEGLVFVEGGETKPRLVHADGWDFNVSHAGDYVVVAVRRGPVGVDLELVREVREMASIVARYFHPDECAAWQALDENLRAEAFFVLWSAREAAMKCAGLGLARGMAVTRVGPEIVSGSAGEAEVDGEPINLERVIAPGGYVMVLARG